MDAFTAQLRAVVATAQLAAAMPGTAFSLSIASRHQDGRHHWLVTVRWTAGPEVHEVERVLDGPPPGVHLLRQVHLPELDRDRND